MSEVPLYSSGVRNARPGIRNVGFESRITSKVPLGGFSSTPLLLSSLELGDTTLYEP